MKRIHVWALLVAVSCKRPDVVKGPEGAPETVLETVRAREVPEPVRARFSVKIRSKVLDIAGTTTGGLIVDRPGKGRLEIFGPLGGPLLTVASDGAGLSVLITPKQLDLVAVDAESALREATGGVAGVDDVFAVLIGDLPFDGASVRRMEVVEPKGTDPDPDSGVLAVLDGPKGTRVDALLDPLTFTPKRLVARDAKGGQVLTATYDPFAPSDAFGGALMPTRVDVYVPILDLSLEARFREFTAPAEPLGPFTVDPPDGFEVRSLESAIDDALKGLQTSPSGGNLSP